MYGGYPGHVSVFVIAGGSAICLFVCAGFVRCIACLMCYVCYVSGCCCYLVRVVMCVWSCLGVSDRCLFCHLLICLRCLCWLFRLLMLLLGVSSCSVGGAVILVMSWCLWLLYVM